MPLPPQEAVIVGTVSDRAPVPNSTSIRTQIRSVRNAVVQTFKTQVNKFGLYRIYKARSLPTHDPHDACTTQQPPSPLTILTTQQTNPYHPYPNEASLQLGQWYWKQGSQKSQSSFKDLLHIIGNESFRPEDVRATNWKAVDRQLGGRTFADRDEWVDEDEEDNEWRKSSIQFSVPFHSRCPIPGPLNHSTTASFYHRSLISVIREKLSDPFHHSLFHYDPYELRWHPPHKDQENQVYGDLFTSDAFLRAHRELQESPPEPDCDLLRVVVALMFASDATQLSNFGTAKLWPLYMYFGNESKYVRSQPRNGLCTHVAYFESVSSILHAYIVTVESWC